MCSKCSVVNSHTVLLAFALPVSPTASPKSSEKRASSRRPENGQRLAGNVGNSEVRPVGHAREIPDCSEQPTGLGYCPPRHCRAKIDRKSTRLNSSHTVISYAVFCLKKKKIQPR